MGIFFVQTSSSGSFATRLQQHGWQLQCCHPSELPVLLDSDCVNLAFFQVDTPEGLRALQQQRNNLMKIAWSHATDAELIEVAVQAGAADWIDAAWPDDILRQRLKVIASRHQRWSINQELIKTRRILHAAMPGEDKEERTFEDLARGYYIFRDMVESAADMIWTVDALGRVIYASPLLGRVLGYEDKELRRVPFQHFIHEAVRELSLRAFMSHLAGKPVGSYEIRLLSKDERIVPVEVASSTLYRTDGNAHAVQSVLRDISKRPSIEQSLARRVQIQNLIGTISHKLLDLPLENYSSYFQECLAAFGQSTSADRCALRIRTVNESNPLENQKAGWVWHSPSLENANILRQQINAQTLPWISQQLRNKQPVYVSEPADLPREAAIDRATLEKLGCMSYIAVPFSMPKSISGFIAVFSRTPRSWPRHYLSILRTLGEIMAGAFRRVQTMKKLQESEKKYRVLAENASAGICMMLQKKFVYANSALLNMLHYSNEEFLLLPLQTLFAPGDPSGTAHLSLPAPDSPNRREVLLQTREGDVIHALLSIGQIDMNGSQGMILMLQDITELKQAQESLQLARDDLEIRVQQRTAELQQANHRLLEEVTERSNAELRLRDSIKEKDVLLRELHHRVKNNLQLILSLLQLQLYAIEEPEARRILSDIRDRIHCMGLVHEILCRGDDLRNIDISQYIRTLASNLIYSYKGNSGQVALEVETASVILTLDAAIAVGLIVNELVSNALKHAFNGRQKGRVSIHLFRNTAHQLVLEISDDGAGLPKNFQLETVESLGLQLVQALTRQLEGMMTMSNSRGTTFRLEFAAPGD